MTSNRFDLPPLSSERESDNARSQRVYAVTNLLQEVFAEAVRHVGAEEAKKIWSAVLTGSKRQRGRPKQSELSKEDVLVFEWLDNGTIPKRLAEFLHGWGSPRFRNIDLESVERHIARLMADRKAGKWRRVPDPPRKLPRYIKSSEGGGQ
jgi:hypothetical protein